MGGALSVFWQSFPPRPIWGVNDIPDLTGKVILVTGAPTRYILKARVLNSVGGNAGVGKETVKVRWTSPLSPYVRSSKPQQLLAHNATVYLAARSAQKANEAIVELKNETGKQAIFLQLDLSDLHAVRKSAQEFLSYVPLCCFCSSRRI